MHLCLLSSSVEILTELLNPRTQLSAWYTKEAPEKDVESLAKYTNGPDPAFWVPTQLYFTDKEPEVQRG